MIQSLERAVKILKLVEQSGDGIRLCDLARACKMNRNTIFNLADTLVNERMLAKTPEGKYVIGDLMLELAGGQKRNNYMKVVEKELCELHLRYPDASIYYSELGNSDIFSKLYFDSKNPGRAKYLDDNTLNPYLTVAGLAFFAFAPEERLVSLRAKNPFEYHGVNAWGNMDDFMRQVGSARKKGYAETPRLTLLTDFKVGIPVWTLTGNMAGAITFLLRNSKGLNEREILGEIMISVGKIGEQ
jgi:DNA-binding IclR family transcriptional regulator